MNTTVDVTFLVYVSTPVYDEVTDGLTGSRTQLDEAFTTYDEALQYCFTNFNSHEVYDDGVWTNIKMMVTTDDENGDSYIREHHIHDLSVNSHYTGPVDNSIPF
jgi:hypothetical protein